MRYPRIRAALYSTPWAILPAKLEDIVSVVEDAEANVERGAFLDEMAEEAKRAGEPYTQDGVRVIPVRGTLAKRVGMLEQASGGVSAETIATYVGDAVADPDVRAILLDIESPGGTVDGAFELAEAVRWARDEKPVVAFADGLAASAAYLLASATNSIVAGETADVGSIGVILALPNVAEAEKRNGVKVNIITGGKYKAAGSPHQELSDDDRAYLQAQVDHLYALFIDRVAEYRGTSAEFVRLEQADGRVFIGTQALERKLIDQIGNRSDAIALARSLADKSNASVAQSRARGTSMSDQARPSFMTVLQLVLEGRGEEVEHDVDRENAEAVVELCWEAFKADPDARLDSDLDVEADDGELDAEESATDEEDEAQQEPTVDAEVIRQQAAVEERTRIGGIREACAALGLSEEYTGKLIERGLSLAASVEAATAEAEERQKALEVSQPDPVTRAPKISDERSGEQVARIRAYQKEHGCDYRTAALTIERGE